MDIGLSLVAIGTVTGIIQGKFIKSLLAFFGPKRLILFGLLNGAAAYLGFGLITVGALAYLICPQLSVSGRNPDPKRNRV